MDTIIEQEIWEYYQNDPPENKFLTRINEIIDSGYCIDPTCKCSQAMMWHQRKPTRNDYDELPANIKTLLIDEYIELCHK